MLIAFKSNKLCFIGTIFKIGKKSFKNHIRTFTLISMRYRARKDMFVKVVIAYCTDRGGALDDVATVVALAGDQPEPLAGVLVLA